MSGKTYSVWIPGDLAARINRARRKYRLRPTDMAIFAYGRMLAALEAGTLDPAEVAGLGGEQPDESQGRSAA